MSVRFSGQFIIPLFQQGTSSAPPPSREQVETFARQIADRYEGITPAVHYYEETAFKRIGRTGVLEEDTFHHPYARVEIAGNGEDSFEEKATVAEADQCFADCLGDSPFHYRGDGEADQSVFNLVI